LAKKRLDLISLTGVGYEIRVYVHLRELDGCDNQALPPGKIKKSAIACQPVCRLCLK
jgi:hypothetical protein